MFKRKKKSDNDDINERLIFPVNEHEFEKAIFLVHKQIAAILHRVKKEKRDDICKMLIKDSVELFGEAQLSYEEQFGENVVNFRK